MTRRSSRALPWALTVPAMALAGCGFLSGGPFDESTVDVCDETMQVQHVAAGDLDGDGSPELVVACQPMGGGWDPGAVEVYLRDPDEGFSLQGSYGFETAPTDVTLADMDADGHLDLVVTVSGAHERTLSVLRGNGDASFSELVEYETTSDLQATTAFDLTGNEALDVLVPGTNRLLANEGSPDQPGPFDGEGFVPMDAAQDLDRADIDGDGQPDTAHIDEPAGTILVYPNGASDVVEVTVPDAAGELHAVRGGGDLNGDGVLDLIVSRQTAPLESEVLVLLSEGAEAWGASEPIEALTGQRPAQVLVTDVTGDGHLDLVRVPIADPDSDDYRLTILSGNGDGTFDEGDEVDVDGFPYRALVADVSGDGGDDLVLIREGEPRNELALFVVEG